MQSQTNARRKNGSRRRIQRRRSWLFTRRRIRNGANPPDAFYPNESKQRVVDLRGSTTSVPSSVRVIMPYMETLNRTPGTFQDDYQYNMNSIFDPNRTGTGHQPNGYDQWANFYGRYRVHSIKYELSVSNSGTSAISVVAVPSNSLTALTITDASEQPWANRLYIGGINGVGVRVITGEVRLSNVTGVSQQTYNGADQYAALFGGSPTETLVLHMYANSIDGSAITYATQVRIWYDVELYDRLQLAES